MSNPAGTGALPATQAPMQRPPRSPTFPATQEGPRAVQPLPTRPPPPHLPTPAVRGLPAAGSERVTEGGDAPGPHRYGHDRRWAPSPGPGKPRAKPPAGPEPSGMREESRGCCRERRGRTCAAATGRRRGWGGGREGGSGAAGPGQRRGRPRSRLPSKEGQGRREGGIATFFHSASLRSQPGSAQGLGRPARHGSRPSLFIIPIASSGRSSARGEPGESGSRKGERPRSSAERGC